MTDAEITIGSIGSQSGPVPGLGNSAAAGIRAYAAYRNATGGVCGRKLVVSFVDDGSDSSRNLAAFKELEQKVLGFVGGNSGADDAGASVVRDRGVPFIGNSNSFEMLRVPSYFGLQPPPASPDAVLPKFRYLVGQGATKAAIVYVAAGGAVSEANRQARLMRAAGMDIVLDLGLPLSTLSYDSAARSVANSGATYLLFIHEAGASASMARSLSGLKSSLKFPEYIVAYGSNFIELAGSAAPGATSWIPVLPSEDGGVVPEQKALLEWFARAAPGSVLDRFAVTWWAATKVFADTLEALPGPIARDALTRQAAATGTYDAAGLIAPVDFGKKLGKGCEIGMVVKDGKWVRMAPESGFMC